MGVYAEWVSRFLADGHAYYCYCTPEELQARREAAREAGGASGYDGHCRHLTAEQVAEYVAEGREPVVRFRMPEGSTMFTDLVRGEVTFDHAHVPDFVLARADGRPLYTLAVAVDDVLMEITHVVRGEDLLSSTPRQIAVYGAMGVPADRIPAFARRPAAVQAQRRGLHQLVPGARVPSRGDLQLPGAARLVAGGEPGGVHAG